MSKTTKDRAPPKTITQLVGQLAYRHSSWQVFADFVEMGAICFSNAADLAQREAREARYMEIVKRYNSDEVKLFPEMLGTLVIGLDEKPEDILGRTYHELELHNKWAGQYFTPFPLCRAMAKMMVGDGADIPERIPFTILTVSFGAFSPSLLQEQKTTGKSAKRNHTLGKPNVKVRAGRAVQNGGVESKYGVELV